MVAAGTHIAAGRVARLPGQVDLEDGMILVPRSSCTAPWARANSARNEVDGLLAGQGGLSRRGKGKAALICPTHPTMTRFSTELVLMAWSALPSHAGYHTA